MPTLRQPPNKTKSMGSLLMKPDKTLQPGDVIFTDRVLYRHYGVYAGDGKVIHYAAKNGDFGSDVGVRETSLKKFSGGGKCTVLQFIEDPPFSGKETVRRARSRIGEKSYSLLFNNCEHFALWCKTGKSTSAQVETAFTAAAVLGVVGIAALLIESSEGA